MKMTPFVRELLRYCWVLAFISAASAVMFIVVFRLGKGAPWGIASLTGFRTLMQGFVNVAIIVWLRRYYPMQSGRQERAVRYILGYLFAVVTFVITLPLEGLINVSFITVPVWEKLPGILVQGIWVNSLVVVTHNLVILRFEKEHAELENSRLKAANLESANLLLKQQIHPHFLFNALSMLKSLYKTDVHAGEVYLSHLVNFLRASLAEPQSRVARLVDEIRLCEDYIEMQQIRFEDAMSCYIDIPGEVLSSGYVPSFSVQSLIENAIKHNEATDMSPLVIEVYYKDGRIWVENNLQVRKYIEVPSGKGLINLIERYRILSGDEVIISQDEHKFTVSIKVLSHEGSDHRG
ncbi:sensor histidine kinase [Chitinophaga rhizophila]|uniref:Histidine kinase n=1 Tax=Chitinophaga rhizophila TaxID=2866212 RepID=A0ABS7G6Q1_9BACT|nr:histidine kinase [Chitinophaga rhizophila]MBW8682965.1 histidine kinase [Chitinophaga rhizophila]